MPAPHDETRREFLLKLARTAAFVPPVMATVAVRPLAGQGGTTGGGGAKGVGNAQTTTSTVGSLSPTAQVISNPTFSVQQAETASPWSPQVPGQPPPWSRPPPTQTGR